MNIALLLKSRRRNKMEGSRRKTWHRQNGFSFVEILVVLAVFSLLTSLIFTQITQARARARDAEREKEIKTLQDALTIFVVSNQQFPATVATTTLTGSDSVSLLLTGADALTSTPLDPLNTGNYVYQYYSADGSTYALSYYLETDSIPSKNPGLQFATP